MSCTSQQDDAVIYKSSNDGQSWTLVFRSGDAGADLAGGDTIAALTVDATDPAHVLAAGTLYHGGFAVQTRDSGRTWQTLQTGAALAHPDALAINPVCPTELWSSWSVMGEGDLEHSRDGGHTWQRGPARAAHPRASPCLPKRSFMYPGKRCMNERWVPAARSPLTAGRRAPGSR